MKDTGKRGRHPHLAQLTCVHVPWLRAGDNNFVVNQHRHEFLDEKWVSFGSADEQVTQGGGNRLESIEKSLHEFSGRRICEWCQVDANMAMIAAP